MDVIDIGCGSGILSIAARLLGARHTLAVDIDPLSIQATLDNARLNGLTSGIEIGLGSVREILSGSYQPAPGSACSGKYPCTGYHRLVQRWVWGIWWHLEDI